MIPWVLLFIPLNLCLNTFYLYHTPLTRAYSKRTVKDLNRGKQPIHETVIMSEDQDLLDRISKIAGTIIPRISSLRADSS